MEGSMGMGSTVVLFDHGVVAGVVDRDIKVEVPEVPESPMPISVDDREDIFGLISIRQVQRVQHPKISCHNHLPPLICTILRLLWLYGEGVSSSGESKCRGRRPRTPTDKHCIAIDQVFLCSSR